MPVGSVGLPNDLSSRMLRLLQVSLSIAPTLLLPHHICHPNGSEKLLKEMPSRVSSRIYELKAL